MPLDGVGEHLPPPLHLQHLQDEKKATHDAPMTRKRKVATRWAGVGVGEEASRHAAAERVANAVAFALFHHMRSSRPYGKWYFGDRDPLVPFRVR